MWAIAQCFPQLTEIIRQNYFHAARFEQCRDGDLMNMIVNVSTADLDRYRKIVADIKGLDDVQKEEAIHVVFNMMQSFVDAAWGAHENLLASVSQHQRQKNGEQTINRMRARTQNGYWVFQAPVGYRYDRTGGHGKNSCP